MYYYISIAQSGGKSEERNNHPSPAHSELLMLCEMLMFCEIPLNVGNARLSFPCLLLSSLDVIFNGCGFLLYGCNHGLCNAIPMLTFGSVPSCFININNAEMNTTRVVFTGMLNRMSAAPQGD